MKKLLYLAIAAVLLMACNQDKPDLVKADAKLFETGGQKSVSLLGLDSATVDSKLVKLGFTQLEGVAGLMGTHKKLVGKLLQPAKNNEYPWTSVTYVYNAPGEKRVSSLSENDFARFKNLIAESKKVYVELYVFYEENICTALYVATLAGHDVAKIDYAYLNFCEALHNQIMNVKGKGDKDGEWAGGLLNYNTLSTEVEYQLFAGPPAIEPDDVLDIDEEEEGVILITDTLANWKNEYLAQSNDFDLIGLFYGLATHATAERDIDYRCRAMWQRASEMTAEEDRKDGVAPMTTGLYILVDMDSEVAAMLAGE